MKLWTTKQSFGQPKTTELSNTFLILEKLIDNRLMEKQVAHTKGEKDALRRLLDKKLVMRELYPSQTQNRKVYYYTATPLGKHEYLKMREKYYRDVKPTFIN
ncbi:MAG: hypothetical protein KKD01_19525 [Proteobacteria bacterium]|nr:hypothetical protein [Pseudomonadota bacterium]